VSRYVAEIFTKQLVSSQYYKNSQFKEALDETFRRVDEILESPEGQLGLNRVRNGGEADSHEGQ
jgi:hypothetical protein